ASCRKGRVALKFHLPYKHGCQSGLSAIIIFHPALQDRHILIACTFGYIPFFYRTSTDHADRTLIRQARQTRPPAPLPCPPPPPPASPGRCAGPGSPATCAAVPGPRPSAPLRPPFPQAGTHRAPR